MNAIENVETKLGLAPVTDYKAGIGWSDPAAAGERSRWCCQQLEEGRVLFFESVPYDFPREDREFLISQRLGDSRFHKNISYRPSQDALRGYAPEDAAARERLHAVMKRYSQNTLAFMAALLKPYAGKWALDYASFRPEAEQDRQLPVRKRNDLLHVDAFPTRPTRGGRILRCFSNINPSQARVWQTTEDFETLARDHAKAAGLQQIARDGGSTVDYITQFFKRMTGQASGASSPYDKFMLQFHDFLKENSSFQANCPKIRLEFPPGSTWMCFTDSVAHSVIFGQYAVEQTVIVPLTAMVAPAKAPLRVLEGIAGRLLVSAAARF